MEYKLIPTAPYITYKDKPMDFSNYVGKGWVPIVEEFFRGLYSHYAKNNLDPTSIFVFDIKQKWGSLRLYVHFDGRASGFGETAITTAETIASTVCELCGKPGTLREVRGWYFTICGSCAEKQ